MEVDVAIQILAVAMEREDEGHKFYLDAAGKTNDARGKKMFQWLAEEERQHYARLSLQRKELIEKNRWHKFEQGATPPLTFKEFPEFSASEVITRARPNSDELDALHMGIEAEKESVNLYSKAAVESTDPEAKALFENLVSIEKGHLELLEAEHDWLRKSKEYFTLHRFSLPGPG